MDHELLERLEKDGFVGITNCYARITNPERTYHPIADQALLENFGVASGIRPIVGAHHGNSVNNEGEFPVAGHNLLLGVDFINNHLRLINKVII